MAKLFAPISQRLALLLIFMLCLLAACYAALRMAWAIVVNPPRAWLMSIAYDQLGNTAANGDPDETISSRAAKARLQGRRWGCVLCKLLDALDKDHCNRFIERDRGRKL